MYTAGFTGTQRGMTPEQKHELRQQLGEDENEEFHHGDCIGADEEADIMARHLAFLIHIHPPELETKRAHCEKREPWTGVYPPKPYLVRNHDIVNISNVVYATPGEKEEQLRSGTWATIRYAKKQLKSGKAHLEKLVIIFPDGEVRTYPKQLIVNKQETE